MFKMKNTNASSAKTNVIVWLLAFIPVIVYKFLIIIDYVSKYVEEDQLAMWYTTAMYGHLSGFEPHFIGQSYGSSLEALVAVPFYWLGIPLWYAVPLATFIIMLLPYALCSFVLLKRNKLVEALVVILLVLTNNWKFDMLTAMPRGFISGFVFTFTGILLIEKYKRERAQVFLGLILIAVGYTNCEATIAIVALAALHYIMTRENKKQDVKEIVIGLLVGAAVIIYSNIIFYKMNPYSNVYQIAINGFDLGVFAQNIGDIGRLFSAFSFVSIANVPISLLALIIGSFVLLIKKKNYKMCIWLGCMVVGSIAMLALRRMVIYTNEFIYCRERMLLFVGYAVLLYVFYLFYDGTINLSRLDAIKKVGLGKASVVVVVVILVLACIKILIFEKYVIKLPQLYDGAHMYVYKVQDIVDNAQILSRVTKEENVDMLFFTDGLGISYGTTAINYGQYEAYYYEMDRRSGVYQKMLDGVYTGRVACVNYVDNVITDFVEIEISNMNLVEWMSSVGMTPGNKWQVVGATCDGKMSFVVVGAYSLED